MPREGNLLLSNFNGVIHYTSDIHAGVSIQPTGRHDYEAFQAASQFPHGLVIVRGRGVFRWDLGRNVWEEAA